MAKQEFEDEKVVDYPSIGEGFYTATFAKMSKSTKTEGGIVIDFILMQKAPLNSKDDIKPLDLVEMKVGTGGTDIKLKKLANGSYFTFGMIQRVYFNPIKPTDLDYLKAFFGRQRKMFAVAFDAYDTPNKTVQWGKLAEKIGSVATFNLLKQKKNPQYVNIDIESLFVLPAQKVSHTSIDDIYSIIDEMKAEKGNKAPEVEDPPF